MQREPASGEKKKKKTSPLMIIILVIAIGVFCFAGYNLLKIGLRYKKAADSYKNVETIFQENDEVVEEEIDPYDILPFKWDFDALRALNPEAKGWIYEKDMFNYPIVQGEDNDKYLHMMFDGTYNPAGALFVDYQFPQGLEGPYAIVYGHNMRDGSMFGKLLNYANEEYYQEHPRMHVMIGYRHYIYKVVGAYTSHVYGFTYEDALNGEDIVEYVKKAKAETPYKTQDVEVGKNSHILVLSTCTPDSADEYRVVAVLVRDHEVKDKK